MATATAYLAAFIAALTNNQLTYQDHIGRNTATGTWAFDAIQFTGVGAAGTGVGAAGTGVGAAGTGVGAAGTVEIHIHCGDAVLNTVDLTHDNHNANGDAWIYNQATPAARILQVHLLSGDGTTAALTAQQQQKLAVFIATNRPEHMQPTVHINADAKVAKLLKKSQWGRNKHHIPASPAIWHALANGYAALVTAEKNKVDAYIRQNPTLALQYAHNLDGYYGDELQSQSSSIYVPDYINGNNLNMIFLFVMLVMITVILICCGLLMCIGTGVISFVLGRNYVLKETFGDTAEPPSYV
eukprot:334104_1